MVFLVLFAIAVSGVIVVILSHNAFAQEEQTLHDRRLSELVNQTSRAQESPQIDVGGAIGAIDVSEERNIVYVVKSDSDIVSVIDGEDNTRIKDIEVGRFPAEIAVSDIYDAVYVTNSGSESVSVIDATTNEPVINQTTNQPLTIPVGYTPVEIALDESTNTVYVGNWDSEDISVIDATTNEPVINQTTNQPLTIPVGDEPIDIAVNELTNTVYVANWGSEGISVIDAETNEVVTGVTFHVEPFNSGYIVCDDPANKYTNTNDTNDLTAPPLAPVGQYVYVSSGTQCMAKPYEGFEFLSWEQNLEDNSTRLMSVSAPASPLDSFLQYLRQNKSSDKPEAKLMTKFGTFTANFKELPPPLPPEFWAQMYAVIATVITALFIPTIVGWFKSMRDTKKLNYFHKQTAALYQDGKLDENDIGDLDSLRNRIGDAYSEGKLNDKHYESLRGEISGLYEEIFRKKIAAIDSNNSNNSVVVNKPIQEQLAQIRNEIKYAFSKGKINEKHYALLNEDISKLDGKEGVNAS